jgi:hypothetical protein
MDVMREVSIGALDYDQAIEMLSNVATMSPDLCILWLVEGVRGVRGVCAGKRFEKG